MNLTEFLSAFFITFVWTFAFKVVFSGIVGIFGSVTGVDEHRWWKIDFKSHD